MTVDFSTKNYQLVADQLRSAQRILAVTHLSPDGDALGSLCFFKELMEKNNKICVAYCAGPLPSSLDFLAGRQSIITDKTKLNFEEFDLIVSLDCATPARTNLEDFIKQRRSDQVFIEIDHHPAFKKVSDYELRIIEAAATTEILFTLANYLKIELSPTMARSLLTGIVTDTGHFIHSSVTKETIATAALMLGQGASLSKLYNQTAKTKTLNGLKLWGLALSRLTINHKIGLVYTILTADDFVHYKVDDDTIEGIASFLSGLKSGKILMILYEKDNLLKGSLRSLADGVDVSRLARALGGGGHVRAAGFTIKGYLAFKTQTWQVLDNK